MTCVLPEVKIFVGGARDYISKVDVKMRRVKETFGKIMVGLPRGLPSHIVGDLVVCIVSLMNISCTMALAEHICPKVLFTGVPVDYKKVLELAFGVYVEAYEGTNNTMAERSAACIALHPAANVTRSWVLWKIKTRSRARFCNMVKLVTTEAIINAMNAIANKVNKIEH
jgi:hypothetical protein